MSSINNGTRRPTTPGADDTTDNSNLSKIAKHQSLFQNNSVSGDNKDDDTNGAPSAKGHGKAGALGKKPAAAGLGAHGAKRGAGQDTVGDSSITPNNALLSGGQQQSLLPDGSEPSSRGDASALQASSDLASSPQASAAVTQATDQLTQDLANPQTSQATLATDLQNLSAAMGQAGITTPIATVVHDLVDPKGAGKKPSQALTAAAAAQGIDLTVDNTDAAAAQTTLQTTLAQSPVVQAAVDLATAHTVRTAGLEGQKPAAALATAEAGVAQSNSGGLAALYASAAKMGVDITGKSDDAMSQAQNNAANKKLQTNTQIAAREAAQNSGGGGGGGGQSGTYKGALATGNTQQYSSIAKSGSGTSAGGWDTTGNEPIAPDPNNPVNWQKEYGISGGFTSKSLDDLLAQLPQLTSQYPDIKNILTNAANSVSPPIPPQLLLSTLGVETSYAQNFGNNAKDGPFQFIASTFAEFGSGDRTNMQDAANAAAKYYRTLLDQNHGDGFAAMRDYNGDIHQGASNSYQADQQSIYNGNVNLN